MAIISKCDIFATHDAPGTDGMVVDALGRSVNPHTSYVWTSTSVIATFAAAMISGYLPDSELLGVIRISTRPGLHALVWHVRKNTIGLYALNPETARPYLVEECSIDRLLTGLRNLPVLKIPA